MVRSAVKLVVWVVNHGAVCRDSCLILVTSEGQARAAIAFLPCRRKTEEQRVTA